MRTVRSLGIEIPGGRAVVLTPEGSSAPRTDSRMFTTVTDGQRAVEIRIVACSGGRAAFPPIVRFLLAGIRRGARGEARIEIGLSLEPGGMLRAWASEVGGGAREEVFFSGIPTAYAGRASGSSLLALVERIRGDWSASPSAGVREAREIREWFTAAPGHGGGKAARPDSADGVLSLQTIAGELASAKRRGAAAAGRPSLRGRAEAPRVR
jgi:hypothetical protein